MLLDMVVGFQKKKESLGDLMAAVVALPDRQTTLVAEACTQKKRGSYRARATPRPSQTRSGVLRNPDLLTRAGTKM